jgi:hypothetical protein
MFETRTLTGLVINHLSAGCLLAVAVSVTLSATSKPFPGTRTAAACIEPNTCHACRKDGSAIQSNNPPSVSLPRRHTRFFSPADGRSLYFLANGRKGEVRWTGAACWSARFDKCDAASRD